MRILMTGATSYLGGRTIPLLQDAGHEVIALTRPGTVVSALSRLRIDSCTWDAAPEAEILVHLATFYSGQTLPGQEEEIVQSNVTMPSRLVARFLSAGGRRVVAAGTCWEDCGPGRLPANLYAASKSAFRTLASSLCGEKDGQLLWMRFTDIVGVDDPRKRLFRIIGESLGTGTPLLLTGGEQPFDPVWIGDAAAAVAAATSAAMDPASNVLDVSIAGGEPASLRQKIQPIFDLRARSELPVWGARPYRRGEPFHVNWRPSPTWWSPRRAYAEIMQEIFGA
jgi:CDP-paratose synthetase